MKYNVEIMYFKSSGKFYSDHEFLVEGEHWFDVIATVGNMLDSGKRPGLVDGHSGYTAVISSPEGYPHCFAGRA